jgi:hypothetical protein
MLKILQMGLSSGSLKLSKTCCAEAVMADAASKQQGPALLNVRWLFLDCGNHLEDVL